MSTPAPARDPAEGSPGVSRRWLLGGGLLVLGAVGGGAVGFALTDPPREVVPDPVPPADVLAAIAREDALLATYDAALAAAANPTWSAVRAEHAAHAAALTALLPAGVSPTPTPTAAGSDSGPELPTPGAADLVTAEQAAAEAARAACLAGNGTAAVLLACIAASESSHAAVLA